MYRDPKRTKPDRKKPTAASSMSVTSPLPSRVVPMGRQVRALSYCTVVVFVIRGTDSGTHYRVCHMYRCTTFLPIVTSTYVFQFWHRGLSPVGFFWYSEQFEEAHDITPLVQCDNEIKLQTIGVSDMHFNQISKYCWGKERFLIQSEDVWISDVHYRPTFKTFDP